MVVYNCILIVLILGSAICFYHYSKEKKLLKQFVQSSRRHRYHKDIDSSIQQKANRYFTFFIVGLCTVIPLIIQNFIEGFIEENWKWLIPFILISVIFLTYKHLAADRKGRIARRFNFNLNRNRVE